MSDIFNPDHYLDNNLLKENLNNLFELDLKELYLKRKKHFSNFKFVILENNNIVFSEVEDFKNQVNNQNIYIIKCC